MLATSLTPMKFDYIKEPYSLDPSHPYISRPLIPVRLLQGEVYVETYALLDSGADRSVFHASFARELLIDLEEGRKQTYYGIGEDRIDVYLHTVKLQVIGSQEVIGVDVGFTYSAGVDAILGQTDFFQHYQIKFERYKERIEINPAKQ